MGDDVESILYKLLQVGVGARPAAWPNELGGRDAMAASSAPHADETSQDRSPPALLPQPPSRHVLTTA